MPGGKSPCEHLTQSPISIVNHDARKERQHKLFGKVRAGLAGFRQKRVRLKVHATNARSRFTSPLHGLSPAQRLFNRVAVVTFGLMLVHSMSFADAYDVGGNYVEGYEIEINPEEVALVEDGGYLVNISPSTTAEARYLDRAQEVTHEVQSGETLSKIAYLYDLKVNSIFWTNQDKLSSVNSLKVGQQLIIPVADGYKVKVKDGENLSDLIKKYKGNEDETKQLAWNGIPEGGLTAGQEILIVGGQPYVAVATARISGSGGGGGGGTSKGVAPSGAPSLGGDGWFKPVSGTLTQGYHAGHYAYDIAGPRGSAIMSAAGGTVVKASSGTWGGGYGTHLIVQHENGCQTLYAHNSELYVSEGDYVSGGQVIAAMGNTGRVYGRTGVHSHFELRCNGVKVNPAPVFGW